MTTDFSVQNKQNTYVDSAQNTSAANSVGNRLANGTAGASAAPSSEGSGVMTPDKNNLTMTDIDSKLNKIVSNTQLSLKDLKNILNFCGYTEEKLLAMNTTDLEQLCCIIQVALKCVTDKYGNLNKRDLPMALLTTKVAVVQMGIKESDKLTDFVKENLKKDLLDIIKEQVPSLKDVSIKDISAQQLKEIFKTAIQKSLSPENKNKRDPQIVMDFLMAAISKCDPDEKAKIFHAFALLLKDKDMQEMIPDAYKTVLGSFGNDIKRLNDFITNVGPEILRELGFDETTIKIINLEALNDLSFEQVQGIIKSVVDALDKIDENDLPILRKVLTSINNGTTNELTTEELKILKKYGPLLNTTITVVAGSANRPELKAQLYEHYKPLFDLLEKLGVSEQICAGVNIMYNASPESFKGKSRDDVIKFFNEMTNNKYSEAIGDTNPDNLYKPESSASTSDFGLPQRTSTENYISALMRQNDLVQTINDSSKSDEPAFLVLTKPIKPEKNKVVVDTTQKRQSVKGLLAKDLFEGLSNKTISIDYVLDNYKDLTHSAKLFVNKLIEIMSPAEQNFRLDGMPNSEAVDIIKHSNINPDDLNLALDYASRKELEEIEKDKAAV